MKLGLFKNQLTSSNCGLSAQFHLKPVETLYRAENEPIVPDGYPMSEWLPGISINYDENIDNYM